MGVYNFTRSADSWDYDYLTAPGSVIPNPVSGRDQTRHTIPASTPFARRRVFR